MPVASSAFHRQPVRRTKRIASVAARSGTRGLRQPKGCAGRGGRSGAISASPASAPCAIPTATAMLSVTAGLGATPSSMR